MQHINIISKQHARIGAGLLKTVMLVSGSIGVKLDTLREFPSRIFWFGVYIFDSRFDFVAARSYANEDCKRDRILLPFFHSSGDRFQVD